MNLPRLFDNPKPSGLPLVSWWAHAAQHGFTETCQREFERMRQSKEHHRMGSPMVIAQVDGKQARTS